jgi:hypothetical protein
MTITHQDEKALGSRPIHLQSQNRTVAASAMAEKKVFWTAVVTGCHASPVLEAPEHYLDPVAAFIAALVMLDGFAARLPTRDAGLYSLVFQGISEPIGIIAPVSQQPFSFGQAAQQRCRTGVVAHLSRRHEEPDRAAFRIGDGVQLALINAAKARIVAILICAIAVRKGGLSVPAAARACLLLARFIVIDDLLICDEIKEGLGLDDRTLLHPEDPDELVVIRRTRGRGG